MGCGAETKDLILVHQKDCIRGCEKFKNLEVRIDKEDRQENYIKYRITKVKTYIDGNRLFEEIAEMLKI